MPGSKTSVWLGEEQLSQWKASGLSLTEIVKRGLAAPSPQEVTAADLAAIRGELTAIRAEMAAAEERAEERGHRNNEDLLRGFREQLERIASR